MNVDRPADAINRRVTRRGVVALAAAAAAAALVGCGADDDSTATPGTVGVAKATPTATATLPATATPRPKPPTATPSPRATPTPAPTTAAKTLTDIVYGTGGFTQLTLDLYYSAANLDPAPLVVFIHGGSFDAGDKRTVRQQPELPELMSRGYAVASLDYRLGPAAAFPAPIEDVKAGVRFLRANSDRYGLDPDRFGGWGQSAGAYLVEMLALTTPADGFEGNGGSPGVASSLRACVDQFGAFDLASLPLAGIASLMPAGESTPADERRRASPATYVSKNAPPFLLQHGAKDPLIPVSQSQQFSRALEAVGVPEQLVVVKNAGHNFTPIGGDISPSEAEIARMVGEFFDKYLKG